MTTVELIKEQFEKHQKTNANTYLVPTKNIRDKLSVYEGELLFVRKIEEGCVVAFRAMDGKFYSLTDKELLNFKLL